MNRLPDTGEKKGQDPLVGWINEHVEAWEDYRDNNYKAKWDEYYRLWRGIWKNEDKMRGSERSRIIAPALQQAIEVTVAELEEALFSKKKWLDIDRTTIEDERARQGMDAFLSQLLKEYDLNKVPANVAEVVLNGAIYGTGIAKVVVESRKSRVPIQNEDGTLSSEEILSPCVKLLPIDPREFVIDPLARSIDEAMGCAHIMRSNIHKVKAKQKSGLYADVEIGSYKDEDDFSASGETSPTKKEDWVKITEYHGKIPKEYLDPIGAMVEDELNLTPEEPEDEAGMVEAIVTIANDSVLLRAVENPFFMHDRSIIAYQHDRVPNRFWGRGVAEKGYSPQKALDAELRARIDAMAFAVAPMIGVNASLVPRDLNTKFKVYPGRTIFTNGSIAESIAPINFNPPPPSSFNQSGDLERMIEMGTGAFQANVHNQNPNQTAGGMGMVVSAAIKRNKRTLLNIEVNLLDEFVKKSAWRYMQADPDKYPLVDLHFVVNSSLGIMAREVETQQIVQLLNTTEPNSTGYWMLIKSLYQLSTISNREEMMPIIDKKLQESLQPQPDPRAEAAAQQAATQRFVAENDAVFKKTKGVLNLAQAEKAESETDGVRQAGFMDELSLMGEMMVSRDEMKQAQAEQAQLAQQQAQPQGVINEQNPTGNI
jgi:hypothetical protein